MPRDIRLRLFFMCERTIRSRVLRLLKRTLFSVMIFGAAAVGRFALGENWDSRATGRTAHPPLRAQHESGTGRFFREVVLKGVDILMERLAEFEDSKSSGRPIHEQARKFLLRSTKTGLDSRLPGAASRRRTSKLSRSRPIRT